MGICSTLAENPYTISDPTCDFPYPISDLKPWSPEGDGGGGTSCYDTYTVGVNIKREMVSSPNDEEVASSKKHSQFKTRVTKVLG